MSGVSPYFYLRGMASMESVLVMAKDEHLRLGYSAVLSAAGYMPYATAELAVDLFAAIVDMGDDLDKHGAELARLNLVKVIYIVSKGWMGTIPPSGAERYILSKPTTAEAIIKYLKS